MKALERGRLLGVDVGNKYVGLAVSDPCNKIASLLRYDVISAYDQAGEVVMSLHVFSSFGSLFAYCQVIYFEFRTCGVVGFIVIVEC
ncbi:hypothetical protein SLEP1_g32892 [Rubroshorea leprosula]|uniref:YqgF/RNase H-like domain-containing protein n=1 Tax=Rubroshorea leprosula TaxID=152421 RepID=A0AAV5KF22_9ROSI|nr:hypothetical protein SLEP1_g32892 [Rubroshorea leprosula]